MGNKYTDGKNAFQRHSMGSPFCNVRRPNGQLVKVDDPDWTPSYEQLQLLAVAATHTIAELANRKIADLLEHAALHAQAVSNRADLLTSLLRDRAEECDRASAKIVELETRLSLLSADAEQRAILDAATGPRPIVIRADAPAIWLAGDARERDAIAAEAAEIWPENATGHESATRAGFVEVTIRDSGGVPRGTPSPESKSEIDQ